MRSGEIVSRGHDLYVVLAVGSARLAVAPLVFSRRSRVTDAVPVRAGALGAAYALCGSARLDEGVWSVTGYSLTDADLTACQTAARHARESATVERRWSALPVFEQALPRLRRSGGRRVGSHPSLA